ncbi:hypothetical protein A0H81_09773 [Grifola frondosa]|uniref:Uncharacterized protein n=1 Tax=Grifola frondosa TaxID=5627 RepID=A0A1C7M1J8_GRIFR|nr:hypothetical protein A0H81_09773 [Grifola frondosa]
MDVWDANERADVKLPEILPASRGPVVMEEQKTASGTADARPLPHIIRSRTISGFITPATVEKLLVGMGVGATWVQVARQDEEGGFGEPTNFWYMEQSRSVLPSFHTEQEQVR